MDLKPSPEEVSFRNDVRAWLKKNMPEPWDRAKRQSESEKAYWQHLRQWQKSLYEGGWAGLSWPAEFGGRDASPIQQAIFNEELALASSPQRISTIGEALVGPTIISVGTKEQKQNFLPFILSAEHIWCQGFSEPNAGSDVAALAARAERDGDHYVINGQKIWTSYAQIADWCMLLVRTDPSAPKHKGISCLLVDMKSQGVDVRPLRQMSGDFGFNEVFFSDVRVPATNLLGQQNEGWKVAITALMNERANLGTQVAITLRQYLEGAIQRSHTIMRNGVKAAEDPIVRQKLAQAHLELEILRLNTNRALTKLIKNETPGPEGSILKLFWSELNQRIVQSVMEMLADQGQLVDLDDGRWVYAYLRSRGNTIEAGTSEIQRNIIAHRVLGLPKSY